MSWKLRLYRVPLSYVRGNHGRVRSGKGRAMLRKVMDMHNEGYPVSMKTYYVDDVECMDVEVQEKADARST